jgi:hypothetical protein
LLGAPRMYPLHPTPQISGIQIPSPNLKQM